MSMQGLLIVRSIGTTGTSSTRISSRYIPRYVFDRPPTHFAANFAKLHTFLQGVPNPENACNMSYKLYKHSAYKPSGILAVLTVSVEGSEFTMDVEHGFEKTPQETKLETLPLASSKWILRTIAPSFESVTKLSEFTQIDICEGLIQLSGASNNGDVVYRISEKNGSFVNYGYKGDPKSVVVKSKDLAEIFQFVKEEYLANAYFVRLATDGKTFFLIITC